MNRLELKKKNDMEIIERFVVLMYDRTSPSGKANEMTVNTLY